jgi:hypothetical protein
MHLRPLARRFVPVLFVGLGLLLFFIALSTSCHLAQPTSAIPVQGTREDVSTVSGEWTGRYWSKETGRRGTIRFSLPAQADTGFGDVDITFSPALEILRNASVKKDELNPKPSTAIDIQVVRIQGGRLRGTMAPYWDPDCDCRAQTVFEGGIAKDRIAGTFETRRASTDRRVLTGKWEATREGGTR